MSETNPNARLETFCDGVFAIAMTLLVIEIKIPALFETLDSYDLWYRIGLTIPHIFSFILSFIVIFITWVNHHNAFKLVKGSSASFIYANGFLLLTVVFLPYPTSLMGEYVSTEIGGPAIALYNAVLALTALGWILICRAAIKNKLGKNESANEVIRNNGKFGVFAFFLYSAFAILAIWVPLTVFILTCITWIFWLIFGINIKHEPDAA